MSYQQCTTCFEGFSGEDEDMECDECLIEECQKKEAKCEKNGGHKKIVKAGQFNVCSYCRVII